MAKELKRSKDKKLFGVAAGIAEYFDVDVTIVRIIWTILILAYGTGLIAYLVCLFVMKEE